MKKPTSQTHADASAIIVLVANGTGAVWRSTVGEFVANHHPSFNRPSEVIVQQIAAGLKSEGRYSVNVGEGRIFTLTLPSKRAPGSLLVAPSSNPKNGTLWRDIVSTEGPFSPSYVGEALEDDARLFAAAPRMLDALKLTRGNVASLYASHPNIWGEWLNVIDAAITEAEAVK